MYLKLTFCFRILLFRPPPFGDGALFYIPQMGGAVETGCSDLYDAAAAYITRVHAATSRRIIL